MILRHPKFELFDFRPTDPVPLMQLPSCNLDYKNNIFRHFLHSTRLIKLPFDDLVIKKSFFRHFLLSTIGPRPSYTASFRRSRYQNKFFFDIFYFRPADPFPLIQLPSCDLVIKKVYFFYSIFYLSLLPEKINTFWRFNWRQKNTLLD